MCETEKECVIYAWCAVVTLLLYSVLIVYLILV